MKNISRKIFLLCLLCCFVSCSTTKKKEVKTTNIASITVTGILKQGKTGFYLKENPDSKSAVTITLTGTEGHEQTLNPLLETDVTITGKLISEPSPWSKEVEFISVK